MPILPTRSREAEKGRPAERFRRELFLDEPPPLPTARPPRAERARLLAVSLLKLVVLLGVMGGVAGVLLKTTGGTTEAADPLTAQVGKLPASVARSGKAHSDAGQQRQARAERAAAAH
ncbi:MAG TPA: hypothetical protein VJT68_03260, partial [Thermoleophilaceae bacterium]|nr:hypothetical protein [Thermoleophilaceae bacterium]